MASVWANASSPSFGSRASKMALIGQQHRLLADKHDVHLIERFIERAAMNFQNVICDKSERAHECNYIVEQRRPFIDFNNRDLEQHRLESWQIPDAPFRTCSS